MTTRQAGDAAGAGASDAELLARIGAGDLEALGSIYDRYHRDVFRVLARAVPDPADVDDLVQDTFLALRVSAARFDGRASCCAWLLGIALRLAARRRRGMARRARAMLGLTLEPAPSHLDPGVETGAREELAAFARALAALAPGKRDAFVLVELEGIAPAEAARVLDVPHATLRTRLFAAREALRRALKDRGAP